MLLIARPGVVNSAAAKATKALLEHSRVPMLGMVVNGVATDNNDYNYYYSHRNTGKNNSDRKDKIKSSLSKITRLRLL
jgi:Mrp family chromosome partitioning ATPase